VPTTLQTVADTAAQAAGTITTAAIETVAQTADQVQSAATGLTGSLLEQAPPLPAPVTAPLQTILSAAEGVTSGATETVAQTADQVQSAATGLTNSIVEKAPPPAAPVTAPLQVFTDTPARRSDSGASTASDADTASGAGTATQTAQPSGQVVQTSNQVEPAVTSPTPSLLQLAPPAPAPLTRPLGTTSDAAPEAVARASGSATKTSVVARASGNATATSVNAADPANPTPAPLVTAPRQAAPTITSTASATVSASAALGAQDAGARVPAVQQLVASPAATQQQQQQRSGAGGVAVATAGSAPRHLSARETVQRLRPSAPAPAEARGAAGPRGAAGSTPPLAPGEALSAEPGAAQSLPTRHRQLHGVGPRLRTGERSTQRGAAGASGVELIPLLPIAGGEPVREPEQNLLLRELGGVSGLWLACLGLLALALLLARSAARQLARRILS
jgi:hypothetical protein